MPEPSSASELLTPRAAAAVKELEFFARMRVEGFLKSFNHSKLKGTSTDFLQHRAYLPGDDIRSLDWRVYARSDRLVVRQHEEYTNLDAVLVLDCSGSMAFAGNGGLTKFDFARRCAAMLAYLMTSQRDRVGVACCASAVVRFVKPDTGKAHLAQLLHELVGQEPAGETDLAACVAQLQKQVRRKGVFVLFSDCYQDPSAIGKALGILAQAGHDVIVYQIFARTEADLDFAGFTLFHDLETGAIDSADPQEIRTAYQTVFRDHIETLKQQTSGFGIEFHSLSVSRDWELILSRLLHERVERG